MSEHDQMVPTGASPPLTPEEQLTQQFYAGEKRGRGWQVWDYPVELEPPFRPFFHYLPATPGFDVARKPTFCSAVAESMLGKAGPAVGSLDYSAPADGVRV